LQYLPSKSLPPSSRSVAYSSESVSLLGRIAQSNRKQKVALTEHDGQQELSITYEELDRLSNQLVAKVRRDEETQGIDRTIASFNESGIFYTVSMIAAWKMGKRFLPLCLNHTAREIKYFLEDSSCSTVLCSGTKEKLNIWKSHEDLNSCNITVVSDILTLPWDSNYHSDEEVIIQEVDKVEDALVVYTSGTTGRPKGVVHTFNGLDHMMRSLCDAWEYSADDKILHFLPLHHVHGILNKVSSLDSHMKTHRIDTLLMS
jgi:malonyl-CoA/methylmalonyl-CoA synthetase